MTGLFLDRGIKDRSLSIDPVLRRTGIFNGGYTYYSYSTVRDNVRYEAARPCHMWFNKAFSKVNGLLIDNRPVKVEVVVASTKLIPQPKPLNQRITRPKVQPKSAANIKYGISNGSSMTFSTTQARPPILDSSLPARESPGVLYSLQKPVQSALWTPWTLTQLSKKHDYIWRPYYYKRTKHFICGWSPVKRATVIMTPETLALTSLEVLSFEAKALIRRLCFILPRDQWGKCGGRTTRFGRGSRTEVTSAPCGTDFDFDFRGEHHRLYDDTNHDFIVTPSSFVLPEEYPLTDIGVKDEQNLRAQTGAAVLYLQLTSSWRKQSAPADGDDDDDDEDENEGKGGGGGDNALDVTFGRMLKDEDEGENMASLLKMDTDS
ncbi:hypothetical protein B0T24DRAFT_598115 [Lasiosphaeria ovina]|uniref:Uncharacterized protein n=1 Tax=Lasiosphaeria ovina TaxID=92902 RepID=A0AAE0MZN0_9PEZI|nr:hypothetical protein B0T24DRAFT_598115 [Lasiosphaeria ovina]